MPMTSTTQIARVPRTRLIAGLGMALAILTLLSGPTTATAQSRTTTAASEDLGGDQLVTRDGVRLSATFLPGKGNQETIPIILLHDLEGDRGDFAVLAKSLSEKGYAVLIPDLRGHGDSTSRVSTGSSSRSAPPLEASKLRPADYTNMAKYDMGALRSFLVKKNNEQELNLNKLVVIGAGMGAAIAVDWARYDWSFPNYAHTGTQQSQDVKALVLLSPRYAMAGFQTAKSLATPALGKRISLYIAAGARDTKVAKDAERMHSLVNRYRREPDLSRETEKTNTLWLRLPGTPDQGARLAAGLKGQIATFIKLRVQEGESTAAWIKHK